MLDLQYRLGGIDWRAASKLHNQVSDKGKGAHDMTDIGLRFFETKSQP